MHLEMDCKSATSYVAPQMGLSTIYENSPGGATTWLDLILAAILAMAGLGISITYLAFGTSLSMDSGHLTSLYGFVQSRWPPLQYYSIALFVTSICVFNFVMIAILAKRESSVGGTGVIVPFLISLPIWLFLRASFTEWLFVIFVNAISTCEFIKLVLATEYCRSRVAKVESAVDEIGKFIAHGLQ
ncbi:hypothetical protein F5Y15DRAFT_375758 [Xylariaceae sp. FL0016]|nr:hypothetical protein F5Y15DRAFT_375758 [Xylariaceae sp. FL0016]